MSLRTKIALTVFLAAGVFVGLDQWLQRVRFERRFSELDLQRARTSMERVLALHEELLDGLQRSAREIGAGAIQEQELDFLVAEAARGRALDLVLGIDERGVVLGLHLNDESGAPLELHDLPNEQLSLAHPLVSGWRMDPPEPPRGLWQTSAGTLIVAGTSVSEPGEMVSAQRWIVGRWLDDALLLELQNESRATFDAHTLAAGRQMTAAEVEIMNALAAGKGPLLDRKNQRGRQVWAALADVSGAPTVLFEGEAKSDLSEMWGELSQAALLSALGMVILFPFAILLLLQGIVTGPLTRLSRQVVQIGQTDDTEARLELERTDEIGQLAGEFDGLLVKLAASRAEVVRTARLAGMSEIASGTLHNVGNLLNSVNVSAKLARATFQHIDPKPLRLVLQELRDHEGDLDAYLSLDPRGTKLLEAFEILLKRMEQACARGDQESVSLEEDVDKISNLVRSLEGADTRVRLEERFHLASAVESALELCLQSTEMDGLEIVRDFEELPRIELDPNRQRDILVQLILNALHAIRTAQRETPRLELTIRRDGLGRVRVEVCDNGVGIDPSEHERIFQLGTTTRPDGKGLGLHLSATMAVELGGTLAVQSEGHDRGATFVLTLPAPAAKPAAA